jgi:hypothetical protein
MPALWWDESSGAEVSADVTTPDQVNSRPAPGLIYTISQIVHKIMQHIVSTTGHVQPSLRTSIDMSFPKNYVKHFGSFAYTPVSKTT